MGSHHFPVVRCTYDANQATDNRGRVLAKVRYGAVQLVLDVPDNDFLLAWAHDPHKRLAADVVYLSPQGSAYETLRLAAYCVAYLEFFV